MPKCNADTYAAICDVVERNYHGWPLEHDSANPHFHTSREAREAAMRILEILGVELEPA